VSKASGRDVVYPRNCDLALRGVGLSGRGRPANRADAPRRRARRRARLPRWCSTLSPQRGEHLISSSPGRIGARGSSMIVANPELHLSLSRWFTRPVHSNGGCHFLGTAARPGCPRPASPRENPYRNPERFFGFPIAWATKSGTTHRMMTPTTTSITPTPGGAFTT